MSEQEGYMVKVENVRKIYGRGEAEVEALRGVSFEVADGEFSALCGPSGSGKTTLLNLIGCLDSITAGDIIMDGTKIAGLDAKARNAIRADKVGFVFQSYNLIPVLTARENVELALQIDNKLSGAEIRAKADGILAEVGLKGLENRRPPDMSGGQQQRVSIARALVKNPPLILADEPTANLDSKTSWDILRLMHELNQKHGTTFLFSTHDEKVMRIVTRLIHIEDGCVGLDERKESEEEK
jgi:putative ABC transport system ATP-binding protein